MKILRNKNAWSKKSHSSVSWSHACMSLVYLICTTFSQKNTEDTVCLKSQETHEKHTGAAKNVVVDFQLSKIYGN